MCSHELTVLDGYQDQAVSSEAHMIGRRVLQWRRREALDRTNFLDILDELRTRGRGVCEPSLENCNGEIYTFDQDFRRVAGITRLEPGA